MAGEVPSSKPGQKPAAKTGETAAVTPQAPMTPGAALSLVLRTGAIILIVDRATKWWVVDVMDLGNRLVIEVMPPYLTFVMAWNRGINFGLFAGDEPALRWGLVALAVIVSAAITRWVTRRGERSMVLAAGIVAGGALGNAWDRVQYGAVADFLNMSCCGIDNPYAFNVADVAIFAGAMFLAWRA
ncbi:MAG: signal peptidase II [Pseudomonadota bacterium]